MLSITSLNMLNLISRIFAAKNIQTVLVLNNINIITTTNPRLYQFELEWLVHFRDSTEQV